MNKEILAIVAMLLCFIPIANVAGDDKTPGDDAIETAFYGTITNNETGEPIENMVIYGFDTTYQNVQTDSTDENGNYYLEFNLGGDYYFYVTPEDYVTAYAYRNVKTNEKTQIDFKLDPIHYNSTFFGIVTDSETGQPIFEVHIDLYIEVSQGSYDYLDDFSTGLDGKYSFDVNDGSYIINFGSYGYYSYQSENIKVSGEDRQLNVDLDPFQLGIYGQVTDENGNPMEGVSVQIDNDYYSAYVTTEIDGKYVLKVPLTGDYTISAFANGHRPFSQDVTIVEGDMKEIDIQMQKSYIPDPILRILYLILSMLGFY
jgi:hypothetical protein